jgi:DNA polymerase phi
MEKNREFLNYFWDLASEDDDKRLQASHDIIQYLKKSAKGEIDIDYVCKRLVRGLSSSRSHARAGFSTCLTEVISLKFIDIDAVFALLDETTKVFFDIFLLYCFFHVIHTYLILK